MDLALKGKRSWAVPGPIDVLFDAAGGSRPIPVDAVNKHLHKGVTRNLRRWRELTHSVVSLVKQHQFGCIDSLTGTTIAGHAGVRGTRNSSQCRHTCGV
jgi:3-oxoacyl-[acyl-carrier protein] reductase